MRRRLSLLGLLSLTALTACGDNTSTTGPTLDPSVVAGIYTPTVLSFDPQGSLPVANLLEAIGQQIQPYLSVATDGSFVFFFLDGQTMKPVSASGSYETLESGIRLKFDKTSDAEALLLLPKELDLTFDQNAGTLSFSGSVQASRARLFQLVPDWQNEPLADPVPGLLSVQFTVIPAS